MFTLGKIQIYLKFGNRKWVGRRDEVNSIYNFEIITKAPEL